MGKMKNAGRMISPMAFFKRHLLPSVIMSVDQSTEFKKLSSSLFISGVFLVLPQSSIAICFAKSAGVVFGILLSYINNSLLR